MNSTFNKINVCPERRSRLFTFIFSQHRIVERLTPVFTHIWRLATMASVNFRPVDRYGTSFCYLIIILILLVLNYIMIIFIIMSQKTMMCEITLIDLLLWYPICTS